MAYITSDGANLFIEMTGRGPIVVFVHGLGLDRRQWDPQWEELARDHAVVRLDLRGHGRSQAVRPPATDPIATLVRDLERALTQVGVDRLQPAILVGQGHSAGAALEIALADPRAVRGVVAVSPIVEPDTDEDWQRLWTGMREDAAQGRIEAALERWRADPGFDGVRELASVWAAIESMHAACTGAWWLQGSPHSSPLGERVANCRVPVLIVAGNRDRAHLRAAAAGLHDRMPAAELRSMDAGHFPNLEQPLEMTRVLHAFSARVAASSGEPNG